MKHEHKWEWMGGGVHNGLMYCRKKCKGCGAKRAIYEQKGLHHTSYWEGEETDGWPDEP